MMLLRGRFVSRLVLHFNATIAITLLLAGTCEAKRIIYVANDKVFTWGEGYYRKNSMPGDTFIRERDGKNLRDAWALLVNGDQLIVMAHGRKGGGGIKLEGSSMGGFKAQGTAGGGTGIGCDPYELPKRNLNSVTVFLRSCYAGLDPDGAGSKISVAKSMEPCFNGNGNSITGHSAALDYTEEGELSGGTEQQRKNTWQCIGDEAINHNYTGRSRNTDWFKSLTYEQHQTIQAVINACKTGGIWDVDNVTIQFTYTIVEKQEIFVSLPSYTDFKSSNLDEPADSAEVGIIAPCESYSCAVSVPSLSPWGLGVIFLSIVASVFFVWRRRRKLSLPVALPFFLLAFTLSFYLSSGI